MGDRFPQKAPLPFPRAKLSAVKGDGLGVRFVRKIGGLPKQGAELRFVVESPEGLYSQAYGIRVHKCGDVYIFPRDGSKGRHISLHASGHGHVRVDEEGRRAEEWIFGRDQPAFHLLLASWGVSHSSYKKRNNEVILESSGSSIAITIVKSEGYPQLLPEEYLVAPIGCLTPANREREAEEYVWVLAYRIEDPVTREEMKRWVGAGFGGHFRPQNPPQLKDGEIFTAEMGGHVGGVAFVVPFQAHHCRARLTLVGVRSGHEPPGRDHPPP